MILQKESQEVTLTAMTGESTPQAETLGFRDSVNVRPLIRSLTPGRGDYSFLNSNQRSVLQIMTLKVNMTSIYIDESN